MSMIGIAAAAKMAVMPTMPKKPDTDANATAVTSAASVTALPRRDAAWVLRLAAVNAAGATAISVLHRAAGAGSVARGLRCGGTHPIFSRRCIVMCATPNRLASGVTFNGV